MGRPPGPATRSVSYSVVKTAREIVMNLRDYANCMIQRHEKANPQHLFNQLNELAKLLASIDTEPYADEEEEDVLVNKPEPSTCVNCRTAMMLPKAPKPARYTDDAVTRIRFIESELNAVRQELASLRRQVKRGYLIEKSRRAAKMIHSGFLRELVCIPDEAGIPVEGVVGMLTPDAVQSAHPLSVDLINAQIVRVIALSERPIGWGALYQQICLAQCISVEQFETLVRNLIEDGMIESLGLKPITSSVFRVRDGIHIGSLLYLYRTRKGSIA